MYNILVDKFKFKKLGYNWYRTYNKHYYEFYYYEGMLKLYTNVLKLSIDGTKNIEFYDDEELFEFLSKTFPKESRYEKLKKII